MLLFSIIMFIKDRNFDWRNGEKYVFMTSFSNAIEKMMIDGNISKNECELLLHVSSFKYFNRRAIKLTSSHKNVNNKLSSLKEKGYLRSIILSSYEDKIAEVLSITPKGDALCDVFYQNLLSLGNDVYTTKRGG